MRLKLLNRTLAGLILSTSCFLNFSSASLIDTQAVQTFSDSYLGSGESRDFTFNINNLLDSSLYLELSSASIYFGMSDDDGSVEKITKAPVTTYSSGRCFFGCNYYYKTQTNGYKTYRNDDVEQASIEIGDTIFTQDGTLKSHSGVISRVSTKFLGGSWQYGVYNNAYRHSTLVYAFDRKDNILNSFSYNLGSELLRDLEEDGTLDVSVTASLSDFNFSHATLSFQGEEVTRVGQVSAIPEPSTLAIFVLGIMGLMACRFKKNV
jgi:hypothetical protein